MTQIRRATESDLFHAARIFREAISSAEWLPEQGRQHTDFKKASKEDAVFVAVDESDRVLGFVGVQIRESFIHLLFVDQRFHGRGIGTALLTSLDDWLPFPWSLKCVDANTHALSFYDSCGWKVVGSGDGKQGKYSVLEYRGKGLIKGKENERYS